MNLSGSKSRLSGATKELSLKWQDTRNYWQDARSTEFERRFLETLFAQVDKTVTVIEKLDEVLAKVKKDCE